MRHFEAPGGPALLLICLAGCAVSAIHLSTLPRIMVDDAFISYRYAQNLFEGRGLVFNAGEHVEGYSNFLWVLLTSLGMLLGAEPIAWTRSLGAASLLGTVVAGAYLTHRLTGSRFAAASSALVIACSTALCASSMSGLETGLFAFLLTAAFLAFSGQRYAAASLLCGVAAITRPEGFAVWAVMLASVVLSRIPGRLRIVRRLAIPCVSILLGLIVFRLAYFGAVLPNSVQAKSAMLPLLKDAVWPDHFRILLNTAGLSYAWDFLRYAFGPLALLAIFPLIATSTRTSAVDARQSVLLRSMLATVCLGLGIAVYNFGDWMSSFRLLTPYLPALTALVICGLCRLIDMPAARRPVLRAPARIFAACLVGWCAVRQFQTSTPPAAGSPDLELAQILNQSRQPQLLAATDVLGRLGFYAPDTRIIDMAGLTDPYIARHGKPRPPFGRNDFKYVLSRRPHFIMNNVRSAWLRHLSKPDFVENYHWVDRPAWTWPAAARNKPRYVFVLRNSVLEQELRVRYHDAAFRSPLSLSESVPDDQALAIHTE